MSKMPHAGEHQNHVVFVGCRDDLLIVSRSARLDQSSNTGPRQGVDSVAEWHQSLAGSNCPSGAVVRLINRPLGRSHPALIADADPDGRPIARQDDAVRFAVGAHDPGEFELFKLLRRRPSFGDDLPLLAVELSPVRALHEGATVDEPDL